MLIECQNCEFYLLENEKFCPNCGYPPDFKPQPVDSQLVNPAYLAFTLLTTVFGILFYFRFAENSSDWFFYLAMGFLAGVILCNSHKVIIGFQGSRKISQIRSAISKNPQTLVYREDVIFQKSSEFDEQLRHIEHLQKENKVLPNQLTAWQLTDARKVILSQIALCELQKERIAVIRMQNKLLPVIYETSELENQEILNQINQSLRQLKAIRLSLTNDYAIEFTGESIREKEIFLQQLEKTAESLFKMRDGVIQNQSSDLQQTSEYFLPEESSYELAHKIESFNIQTLLKEFDDSYKRFEHSYLQNNSKIPNNNL